MSANLLTGDLVARDRWTRPLIPGPNGEKPRAYTRVSTMAKVLDDKTALTKWKQRMTAIGLAQRPDLLLAVQTAGDDKRSLDVTCEAAMEHAGASTKATIGTALHTLTEYVDTGRELPEHLDADTLATLAAYQRRMAGIEVVASELFVVNDEIEVAGSFDRLVRWKGELVVLDLKTGQHEPNYPTGACAQIAMYAHGKALRPTGQRVPLGPVSQEVGLMLWAPSGQGIAELFELDITAGWEAARLAAQARKWTKSKPIRRVG